MKKTGREKNIREAENSSDLSEKANIALSARENGEHIGGRLGYDGVTIVAQVESGADRWRAARKTKIADDTAPKDVAAGRRYDHQTLSRLSITSAGDIASSAFSKVGTKYHTYR